MSDEKPGAAVADAPETPVGPPEVPALPDQETEATEPQAPQEPSDEVSGTEPGEETTEEPPADPLEAFVVDFTDSVNEDPELAKRMLAALPQELRDSLKGPEADKSEWEASRDRQGRLQSAGQATQPYAGQAMEGRAKAWADTLATSVRGAAQGLLDSQEGSVDLVDAQKLAGEIAGEVGAAASAYWHWGTQSIESAAFDALEKSPAHRHLSADDRAALKAGATKSAGERVAEAVALYVGAAVRAAPESIKAKATEAAEKKAGILGRVEKLQAALPKNGKAPKIGTPASQTPRNEQEARDWNATGKWSTAKLRAWLNSQ
jgi:hypothetical protein